MSLLLETAQLLRKLEYGNKFESDTKVPLKAQERKLLEIVRKNKDTLFGKQHKFHLINSVEDYQKNVEVYDYKKLAKFIAKIEKGEKNILTAEDPIILARSSGTTGKPKHIPVTPSFIKEYRAAWQEWVYFAYKNHPEAFQGKIFTIVSPKVEGILKSGMPYGSISGVINEMQSNIVKKHYAIPEDAFKIGDYNGRNYVLIRIAIEQDVSMMITPNPSMILLLLNKLQEFKEDIVEDIRKGTITTKVNIGEGIRESLEKRLRPNPKRAEELEQLIKKRKNLYPKDFWPHLALIGCWKEGTVPIYLRQFPKLFGKIPSRDIGYMATEGRASVPIQDVGGDGILAVDTHFYEFIGIDDKNKKNPKVLTCDKLEKDKEYFILFTNSAGLYRYNMNDVIRVTGFYNKTPKIKFMHKGEHMSSITGEKLTEWQVVKAMQEATKKVKANINMFTSTVEWGNPPRYIFLVESTNNLNGQKKKDLIKDIDIELKRINIEYKSKRDSERLGHPVLKIIEPGSYETYYKERIDGGSHAAQVKLPSLVGDLNFGKQFHVLEEIRIAEMGAVLMLSFLVVSFIKLSGEGGITGAAVGAAGTSANASLIGIVGGALLFSIILLVYVILIKKIKDRKDKKIKVISAVKSKK